VDRRVAEETLQHTIANRSIIVATYVLGKLNFTGIVQNSAAITAPV
jgi:hypothetical protein